MSEQRSEIDRATADVLDRLAATSPTAPDLALHAATPLTTLPPELVAVVVGRVQAGASAFGADHPRAAITRRIVLPSAVLTLVDAVGLIAAAATGHIVLAVIAAVLLVILAYLTFAGVRFVRTDPLRVTPEQRAYVESAKQWQSTRSWTDELRSGPWGRLVAVACAAAGRIAGSNAWTWASVAGQRAETELARTLDSLDGAAFTLATEAVPAPLSATSDAVESYATEPDATEPDPPGDLVRRVAALRCCADALDDLVRRSAQGTDLRAELPRVDAQRLADLLAVARTPAAGGTEPS